MDEMADADNARSDYLLHMVLLDQNQVIPTSLFQMMTFKILFCKLGTQSL